MYLNICLIAVIPPFWYTSELISEIFHFHYYVHLMGGYVYGTEMDNSFNDGVIELTSHLKDEWDLTYIYSSTFNIYGCFSL